jgi:nicotinate-nucleotide adenylyltransferase
MEVSGTEIRSRRRAGRSIRYLVPDAVRTYIEDNGLYRAPAPSESEKERK